MNIARVFGIFSAVLGLIGLGGAVGALHDKYEVSRRYELEVPMWETTTPSWYTEVQERTDGELRVSAVWLGLAVGCFLARSALRKHEHPKMSQENDNASTRIPCPHCAELIMPTAKKCRYCGSLLTGNGTGGIGVA